MLCLVSLTGRRVVNRNVFYYNKFSLIAPFLLCFPVSHNGYHLGMIIVRHSDKSIWSLIKAQIMSHFIFAFSKMYLQVALVLCLDRQDLYFYQYSCIKHKQKRAKT